MKAIVTGGAGFIGSNVVQLLNKKNYEVVVFDNLSTGFKDNLKNIKNVKLIEGDIYNKVELDSAMRGCNIVFHLAANVGNIKSINDPEFDSQINVIGTLNVLNCARKNKINKIVYSSSAAIFGEPKQLPINEEHSLAPDSPYGVSKLAGELHCICYNKLYNMKNICLRYFNVFGINQRFDQYGNVIPIFTSYLLQNNSISIFGDGEQTRDFVNVKDVANANILAAENENLSGVFNIGSGKGITINYLADMMLSISKSSSKIKYLPARKGEVLHSLSDITKAKKYLFFEP
ncbi:MAG: NAD-dependent epimerase/dehydratase family protein, partial [Candidatus Odinarchaeota archaeon]